MPGSTEKNQAVLVRMMIGVDTNVVESAIPSNPAFQSNGGGKTIKGTEQ